MTPILQVSIEGDCSGLQRAVNNSHNALDSLNGRRAGVAVGLTGAGAAVTGLRQVSEAAGSVPPTVTLGIDASGIAAARGQLSGLRGDVRAAGRDFDSLSGSRVLGFSDAGSLRQLTQDLSGATRGVSTFSSESSAGLGRVDSVMQSAARSTQAMNAEVSAAGRSTAVLDRSLGGVNESAAVGSRTMNAFEQDMASASSTVDQGTQSVLAHTGAVQGMNAAYGKNAGTGSGNLKRDLSGADNSSIARALGYGGGTASPAIPSGPPPDDPFHGGGGGGGGGFFERAAGGGESGSVGMGAAFPVLAAAAVGLVEALAPAAIGMMAMNQVVKDTPALSYAAGKAQAQMADGIRQGSQGATAIGVPAYQKLGTALHGLGEEMGQIGKANIGGILGAETSLTGGATKALASLAPTIGPSISAVENLGNAFLNGIANPSVTQAITATANALSTPGVADAVSTLVQAVATVAPYAATAAAQVFGDIGGSGAGASNVGTGWMTQPFGETVAQNTGGILSYNPATDSGQVPANPLPGGGGGVSWNQNSSVGRWATAAGSLLNLAGTAVSDEVDGSGWSGAPTPERQAANADVAARWQAATSGQGLGGGGVPASAQTLATSQAAAPFGYDQGPGGSLTPSTSIGSGGGYYPGAPAGRTPADVPAVDPATGKLPQSAGTSPTTDTRAPSPGSSGTTLTPQQVQSLSSSLPSLSSNLQQTGSSAQQMSSGMQQVPRATQQIQQGLQQVGQSAQQMSAPMQQAAQHTAQAAQAVTQMAQQAPQAVSAVQQIAPAAHAALAQAAPAIQAGGQAMGAQMPAAVASGVNASAAQATDASCAMVNAAAKSAAACLKAQSPSKVFVDLGVGVSQGLAIGITTATPQATAAVSSAMQQVVAAGQQGLQAASPSKSFQSMGQQALQQTAAGANSYNQNSASQRQPGGLYGDEARYADAQKQAEDQRKLQEANSPEARGDKNYQNYLDKMGYDQATKDRLMKKHEDDQKKDQDKPESERQKLNQSAFDRTKANQLDAMRRAGISGLTDDPNDPASKLSPMGQFKKNELDKSKAASQLGRDAVMAGVSPQQLLNSRQNASLGAGPDRGKPSGFDPGQKSTGFGDPGLGQNKSNYDGGKAAGRAGMDGFRDGAKDGADGAAGATSDATQKAIDASKHKAGVSSPSTVFHGIGGDLMLGLSNGINAGGPGVTASIGDVMSGALGAGVTVASNGVIGIASNAGLAVGYQWAQNVITGADSVLKTSDFSQVSLPQIGTALATTALGVAGLLPPAGSGASTQGALATVTPGAGTPAVPVINNYISIDGTQLDARTRTVIEGALNDLADSVGQQAG